MEDAHIADVAFDAEQNLSLFAVFDGHVRAIAACAAGAGVMRVASMCAD